MRRALRCFLRRDLPKWPTGRHPRCGGHAHVPPSGPFPPHTATVVPAWGVDPAPCNSLRSPRTDCWNGVVRDLLFPVIASLQATNRTRTIRAFDGLPVCRGESDRLAARPTANSRSASCLESASNYERLSFPQFSFPRLREDAQGALASANRVRTRGWTMGRFDGTKKNDTGIPVSPPLRRCSNAWPATSSQRSRCCGTARDRCGFASKCLREAFRLPRLRRACFWAARTCRESRPRCA